MDTAKQVTVLFGSGADTDYNKDLKSGDDFYKNLVVGNYYEERKSLLSEDYAQWNLIHPNSKNIFVYAIYENLDDAREIFQEEIINLCIKKSEKCLDDIEHEKIRKFCKKIYDFLANNDNGIFDYCLNNSQKDIQSFFWKNIRLFESIDGKFNYLRDIKLIKGTSTAKKVLNTYASIFVQMINEAYILPKNFQWNYRNVIDFLSISEQKYESRENSNTFKSYYEQLMQVKKDKIKIATTNYTDFVNRINDDKVTYLHGNLKWFEDYKRLKVYDISNCSEREEAKNNIDSLMPFILIPSGIKPIICKKQILEFNDFIRNLSKSRILLVVGYRFNSEDNHINSIICEWLRNDNNKLIVFSYNGECNLKDVFWLEEFSNPLEVTDVARVVENEKIIIIPVDKNNARKNFSDVLMKLDLIDSSIKV